MSDREHIPDPADVELPKSGRRFLRFFAALRSRALEAAPMGVRDAHVSGALGHLGNIAFRPGREPGLAPETERFKDNSRNPHRTREYRKGVEVPNLASGSIAKV